MRSHAASSIDDRHILPSGRGVEGRVGGRGNEEEGGLWLG